MKALLITFSVVFALLTIIMALVVSILSIFIGPFVEDEVYFDEYHYYPDNEI